jgi:uncharacterized membrane protein
MSVRALSDFFPPLGFLSWVTGAGAFVLGWRVKSARYWIFVSVLMIVCEGLFSVAFKWPRNKFMLVEGTAVHSAEVLRQVAHEFQRPHWARFAFNVAASVSIFVGVMNIYRHKFTSSGAHRQT